jgi:tellurite resistance protein
MVFGAIFGGAKKLAGQTLNKNELEAAVAVGVLFANASGGIDAAERDQLYSSLANTPALKDFDAATIRSKATEYIDALAAGPRSGKAALKKEIEDVNGDPTVADRVFLVGLDVADHGGLDDAEKAVGREIAGWLRLNPKDYDL